MRVSGLQLRSKINTYLVSECVFRAISCSSPRNCDCIHDGQYHLLYMQHVTFAYSERHTVLGLICIAQGQMKPASCLPASCSDLKKLNLHQFLSQMFKSNLISEYLSMVSRMKGLK